MSHRRVMSEPGTRQGRRPHARTRSLKTKQGHTNRQPLHNREAGAGGRPTEQPGSRTGFNPRWPHEAFPENEFSTDSVSHRETRILPKPSGQGEGPSLRQPRPLRKHESPNPAWKTGDRDPAAAKTTSHGRSHPAPAEKQKRTTVSAFISQTPPHRLFSSTVRARVF